MSAETQTKRLSNRTVGHLIIATICLLAAAGFALLLYATIRDAQKSRAERLAYEADVREKLKVVWIGSCPVTGLLGADLVVSCNGKEWDIRRNEAVRFSYALNPGPLDCEVNGYGPQCRPRPFKPAQ